MTDDMNWREKKGISPLKFSVVEVEVSRYKDVKAGPGSIIVQKRP